MAGFLDEYFISPLLTGSGYNPVNTTFYALVFALFVFSTIKLFERFRIKIDRDFITGLAPFIVLGSLLRVLEDAAVIKSIWLVTPLVYILVYASVLGILSVSVLAEKKTGMQYWKIMFFSGIVPCIWAASFLRIVSPMPFVYVAAMTSAFVAALICMKRISKPKFLSKENSIIIAAHLFDASTTFTALTFYNYFEQHVIAGFLMGAFGNFSIFILKIAVIVPVIWLVDMEIRDSQSKSFAKLAIFILGFGPGLRNLLRMMMAV